MQRKSLFSISDSDLLARLPVLVNRERAAVADVIEHLIEIERRRLFLEQACSSLYTFCIERLGYSEDEALKRARVARLAERLPSALEELRSGALHLTGLFLLAPYLTEQNAEALLAEARGKSRKAIEHILARWFPRLDVEPRMEPVASQGALPELGLERREGPGPVPPRTCPGQVTHRPGAKVEPLSASSYRVEFTASPELVAKIEQAREILSHALPSGELPALFERAIDALIESELRRRRGAGRERRRRPLKSASRHVPVDVARQVWERDGGQCTYVDASGRRCSERRFLTLEHKHPHALGGPSTVENLCLLCSSHNAHTARQVFGAAHIEKKRSERARPAAPPSTPKAGRIEPDPREQTETKVFSALCNMGFGKRQVHQTMAALRLQEITPDPEALLRAGLALLVPAPACSQDDDFQRVGSATRPYRLEATGSER